MFRQIMAMTWKDLKIFFKDPGALMLVLLQPIMFIVIMSYAMGGLFSKGDNPIRILVVNEDSGRASASVIRDLGKIKGFQVETAWEGKTLDRKSAEGLIVKGKRGLALVFPVDFSALLEQGPIRGERKTAHVDFIVDPATPAQLVEPVAGTLQGLLERTAYTSMVPKGIDYMFDEISPGASLSERNDYKARVEERMSGGISGDGKPVATVERVVPAGMQAQQKPDAFQQNVPGYTIYGLFWIVSLMAGSILREKREGTFQRLLAAPVSRGTLLAGKLAPHYLINLIQLAIIFMIAALFFGMSLGRSASGLILVSLAVAASATGLGILVAALARTEAQAGGLTVTILLSLSALGGCFVPRFVMPAWLQTAGLITPHAWALDAYQDLLVRGYDLSAVLPKVGALCAFAAIFFIIGLWRFRFDNR